MQKLLTGKLDEVCEKTAVLRVVLDQKHEKQTGLYKELHGGTYNDIRNLVALVLGLGPVVPELKKVVGPGYVWQRGVQPCPADPPEHV